MKKKYLILFVFIIGSITPVTEMIRTYNKEKEVLSGKIDARIDMLPSVFQEDNNECYYNFIGNENSTFKIFLK